VEVRLVPAAPSQRRLLDRLLQLYEYDFSEYGGVDVDAEGLFPTEDLDATWRPGYDVLLIEVDGRTAGFAMTTTHRSFLGDGDARLLDQLFVMRKYRRRGVATRAVTELFDRFPGAWELGTPRGNLGAQAFWRRVIAERSGGEYREVPEGCERFRGVVWAFRV
jgi:predicted acetyltransferase